MCTSMEKMALPPNKAWWSIAHPVITKQRADKPGYGSRPDGIGNGEESKARNVSVGKLRTQFPYGTGCVGLPTLQSRRAERHRV